MDAATNHAVARDLGPRKSSGPALLLRGLRKAFGDVRAVDGIDLEVAAGECFGLLGPNGAGKTTTIEICEGLTAPDAGTVELLGLNWQTSAKELRQRIGIQLQETQFPDKLTVEETLRLFRSFYQHGISVEESIRTAQLEEKRRARVGGLSGGQKQRLAMATALVGDPELLFLDEPTTGLDPQARRHVWDVVEGLKQAGRTIILTTHYMEEAERLCDRVAIMDHGHVIALGHAEGIDCDGGRRGHCGVCGGRTCAFVCGCGGAEGDSRSAVASHGRGAAPAFGARVAYGRAADFCSARRAGAALERVQDALGDAGGCVCAADGKESAR